MPQHPAEKFAAPNSILPGIPLKDVLGKKLILLIGESLAAVWPKFDRQRFVKTAMSNLEELALIDRARKIGQALAEHLPPAFREAQPILLASLGPELTKTESNGLATFFYLPHAHFISDYGVADFELGMQANYELTKRFTAEFSVRPYIQMHPDEALEMLLSWTRDPNPHVRRLCSEGTRPRLPWASRLKALQADPQLALPILEQLKDDADLYVRRSVANHVADILKDHPEVAFAICERWLKEVSKKSHAAERAAARKWIIRHAVRLPAKKDDPRATKLRLAAK